MASSYVTVRMEELGEPEVCLWCDSCALPSGAAADYVLMLDGKPDRILHYAICLDCGRDLGDA